MTTASRTLGQLQDPADWESWCETPGRFYVWARDQWQFSREGWLWWYRFHEAKLKLNWVQQYLWFAVLITLLSIIPTFSSRIELAFSWPCWIPSKTLYPYQITCLNMAVNHQPRIRHTNNAQWTKDRPTIQSYPALNIPMQIGKAKQLNKGSRFPFSISNNPSKSPEWVTRSAKTPNQSPSASQLRKVVLLYFLFFHIAQK